LLDLPDFDRAGTAWDYVLSRRFVDDRTAREYVNALMGAGRDEPAARAWAAYHAGDGEGFLETNWVFNGGFESNPVSVPLDWQLDASGDDVQVAIDPSVARTGSRSLRVKFGGHANVDYQNTRQAALVPPGRYRLTAFLRADGLTTDQGLRLRIDADSIISYT